MACQILAQQATVFEVIISEQINMNLSNERGKKPYISFQFPFFGYINNIVPVALIALEATIKTRELP